MGGILVATAAIFGLAANLRRTSGPVRPESRRPVVEGLPTGAPAPAEAARPETLRDRILAGKPVTAELLAASDALQTMAADDPDERCRAFAVRALSLRNDPAFESFLADRLLLDPAMLPRYAAVRGLERLEILRPATLGALQSALRTERSEKVIDGIRDALARHEPRNGSPLGGDEW